MRTSDRGDPLVHKVMFGAAAFSVLAAFGAFFISSKPGVPSELVLIGFVLMISAVGFIAVGAILSGEHDKSKSLL